MNLRLSTLCLTALLALLTGCVSSPKTTVQGHGDAKIWHQQQAQLSKIDTWTISGKLGLRSPQQNGSGTLIWAQRGEYFDILLSGPLGRGATRLKGHPGAVTLDASGQGQLSASTPEELAYTQLGWNLPVSNILWWIRGLPVPDIPAQAILNDQSHLARLTQDNWNVEYLSYSQQNGFVLPERLRLTQGELAITLVVKEWNAKALGRP